MLTDLINYIEFSTADPTDECRRLFHGRGHAYKKLAHINVDWFSPVILITLYDEVDDVALHDLAKKLVEHLPACESVQVQYRSRPLAPFELLIGKMITELDVIEHGLKYRIQLGRSQNVGLFLDMSNGRQWVMNNVEGKKVLNLFSFTCPFSVAALAGGARHVYNVDNNSGVLNRGRENHLLNKHDMRAVRFDKIDIFKSFGRLKKHGPYGLLISDPPSFQQGSVDIKRDYSKIIRRIPQLMQPGAKIMLCLNSPDLDENFLHDMVNENCPACQFIEALSPLPVFKEAVEGKGLKVLIFEYQPQGAPQN